MVDHSYSRFAVCFDLLLFCLRLAFIYCCYLHLAFIYCREGDHMYPTMKFVPARGLTSYKFTDLSHRQALVPGLGSLLVIRLEGWTTHGR